MNQSALLAWPVFAGICGVIVAVKYPKTRPYVAVAVAGYFLWSVFKHSQSGGQGGRPQE
jgi:ABC-type polysaccharide/polyol phosphate export permease